MLIVRNVFMAKPGKASKFADLLKRATAKEGKVRILTDAVGTFNSVVMETEVESLAAWEELMAAYKRGEMAMDEETAEAMKGYTERWVSGHREIWRVVE